MDTLGATGSHDNQVTDRRTVVEALARLPIRQRQIIVLRYFEDRSVEETAELLDLPTGTVKSYTSRGLARLRELLADHDTTHLDHSHIARTHHG